MASSLLPMAIKGTPLQGAPYFCTPWPWVQAANLCPHVGPSACPRLAILGYRRPLEDQDLWSLNKENRSETVVQRLLEAWKRQQKQAAQ